MAVLEEVGSKQVTKGVIFFIEVEDACIGHSCEA